MSASPASPHPDVPSGLAGALSSALRSGLNFTLSADALSREPGSYLLLVHMTRPFDFETARLPVQRLTAGWYLYCGSARGPGGMQARVARHMRPSKTERWHIDRLTVAALSVHAAAFSDMSECEIVAGLLRCEAFSVPVPGFGSSDCRTCPSHLVRFGSVAPQGQ